MSTAPATDTTAIQIENQALTLSQQCRSIKVVDQPTYDQAVELRLTVKDFLTQATKFFEPMREAAYKAYQAVLTKKNTIIEPAERDLKILDGQIASFTREQQRIEDQRRRDAEIEQLRIEEMNRQAQAVDAIEAGADEESVEAIVNQPIILHPVHVEPTYEKSKAIATVDNWKAEINSLKKFVKHIAKESDRNPGLLELLVGLKVSARTAITATYQSPGLNKMATAQKQSLTLPGVRVYNDSYVKSNPKR